MKMAHNTVSMNLHVNDFTSRVLGVIKEKYGLRNKSEALEKFVGIYGDKYAEREVKDGIVREVIEDCESHFKKYGYRTMKVEELDKLCGIK